MTTTTCNTHELTGKALAFAVAKAGGTLAHDKRISGDTVLFGWWLWGEHCDYWIPLADFDPGTKWAHGGPIIERENITVGPWDTSPCMAHVGLASKVCYANARMVGSSMLICAMRAYVQFKLGDTIEIPTLLLAA